MAKKSKRRVGSTGKTDALGTRIRTVWKNLVLFIVLFALSFLLQRVSSSDFFINLFWMLAVLFAFVACALFIVLVVFLIVRAGKK